MIGNIFILNNNFETVGLVDTYKSLIWANRYNDLGDCELYVPASNENMNLLKRGYYIRRSDDDMVCRIKKVELDTSPEDGNYLIVTGYDVKQWLDQRVVWEIIVEKDIKLEALIYKLIENAFINPENENRKIKDQNGNIKFKINYNTAYLRENFSGSISYANIGETIRAYCKEQGWGYRVYLENDGIFYFQLYKGIDRSNTVVFADEYENLSTTKCTLDDTNIENVALIAGAGSGSERLCVNIGDTKGADRYELFVDNKDTANVIKYEELISLYSGGSVFTTSEGKYFYQLNYIEILILNNEQKAWLLDQYPGGQVVTHDASEYYRLTNINIAELPKSTPGNSDDVKLLNVVYNSYLYANGGTVLGEYGAKTTFEGTAIPEMQYAYKEDYNLGDLVRIRTDYGISAEARITEVIEVSDENGYSVEPKLEYKIS